MLESFHHLAYQLAKPLLFSMDPEKSHYLALNLAKRFPSLLPKVSVKKPVKLLGLDFKNPVGLAAGFDKNAEHLEILSKFGFGFIEVGSVTPNPQTGNPKPRLKRLVQDEALHNRMGLNNLGVEQVARNIERYHCHPALDAGSSTGSRVKARDDKPGLIIGASFTKNNDTPFNRAIDDYLYCFERLCPVADYLVADVSCPNTGDLDAHTNLDFLETLCAKLKESQQKPLLLKLSPDWDIDFLKPLAQILLKHKIDGVICGNTSDGLSGKPLFPKALALVKNMHENLRGQIPIIACGGISSSGDIQKMRESGAQLFQIYTALVYQGPGVVSKLLTSISN